MLEDIAVNKTRRDKIRNTKDFVTEISKMVEATAAIHRYIQQLQRVTWFGQLT